MDVRLKDLTFFHSKKSWTLFCLLPHISLPIGKLLLLLSLSLILIILGEWVSENMCEFEGNSAYEAASADSGWLVGGWSVLWICFNLEITFSPLCKFLIFSFSFHFLFYTTHFYHTLIHSVDIFEIDRENGVIFVIYWLFLLKKYI
jgi:hypothetical protein